MARVDDVSAAAVDDARRQMAPSTAPLPLGPIGDVATARSVARRLLLDSGSGVGYAATFATLLLTALCLHAGATAVDKVSLKDVTELLRRLQLGELVRDLRESPMQFVCYATAELDALEVGERRSLLQALLLALDSPVPGATKPGSTTTSDKTPR